jgi:hypothetical protein
MGPVSVIVSRFSSLPDSGNAALGFMRLNLKHEMIFAIAILTLNTVGLAILGGRLLLSHSLPYGLPI